MLKVIILALSMCAVAQAAMLAGGWTTGDISEVAELAKWSTQQMPMLAGMEGEYTVMTPRNVQKQVVAGVNYKFTLDVVHKDTQGVYRFKSCEMHIFEQSWTNTRRFASPPTCSISTVARSGQWTPVTAITDDILEVARLTGKQMHTQGFQGEHQLAKVYNVQKQVVNGINYKFTSEYLVVAADNTYLSNKCEIQVNHQAWNNNKISFLQTPVCTSVKQTATGSWTSASTAEVSAVAQWSVSQLASFTGVTGQHTVMTTRNMQKQVVAGVNYKFTLDVVAQDSATNKFYFKSCEMFINEKAWANERTFVEEPKCGAHPNFQ